MKLNDNTARIFNDDVSKILNLENGKERRVTLALYVYFHFHNKNLNISKIQDDFQVKTNNHVNGITTHIKNAINFLNTNGIINSSISTKNIHCRKKFDIEIPVRPYCKGGLHTTYCDISKAHFNRIIKYIPMASKEDTISLQGTYVFIRSLIAKNYKNGFGYMRINPKNIKDVTKSKITCGEDGRNIKQILGMCKESINDVFYTLKMYDLIDFTYYSSPEYPIATPYYFFITKQGKANADLHAGNSFRERQAVWFVDAINNIKFRFKDGLTGWDWNATHDKLAFYKNTNKLVYADKPCRKQFEYNDISEDEFYFDFIPDNATTITKKGKVTHYNSYFYERRPDLKPKNVKMNSNDFVYKKYKDKKIHPFIAINSKAECLIDLFKDKLTNYKNIQTSIMEDDTSAFGIIKKRWKQKFRKYGDLGYEKIIKLYEDGLYEGQSNYAVVFKNHVDNYLSQPYYQRLTMGVRREIANAINKIVAHKFMDKYFVKVENGYNITDLNGNERPEYMIKSDMKDKCWWRLWNYLLYFTKDKFDLAGEMGLSSKYQNPFRTVIGKGLKYYNRALDNALRYIEQGYIKIYRKYSQELSEIASRVTKSENYESMIQADCMSAL